MKDKKCKCVAHIDSDTLIRAQANGLDLKSLLPLLHDIKRGISGYESVSINIE